MRHDRAVDDAYERHLDAMPDEVRKTWLEGDWKTEDDDIDPLMPKNLFRGEIENVHAYPYAFSPEQVLKQYKKPGLSWAELLTKENKMKDITIKPAMNGYIVTVGCRTVVFETQKRLLSELKAYLDDPDKTETRYEKNAINSGSDELPDLSLRETVRGTVGG